MSNPDPSPPPREEWQVQAELDGDGHWSDYSEAADSEPAGQANLLSERYYDPSVPFRLVRREWRLESEEVVDE